MGREGKNTKGGEGRGEDLEGRGTADVYRLMKGPGHTRTGGDGSEGTKDSLGSNEKKTFSVIVCHDLSSPRPQSEGPSLGPDNEWTNTWHLFDELARDGHRSRISFRLGISTILLFSCYSRGDLQNLTHPVRRLLVTVDNNSNGSED